MGPWSETPLKTVQQRRVGVMLHICVRTQQQQWEQHPFCNMVILGVGSILRTSQIFTVVLITYHNFPEIPSAKQKYRSNSFTGSILAHDHWARTPSRERSTGLWQFTSAEELVLCFPGFLKIALALPLIYWVFLILFSLNSCPENFCNPAFCNWIKTSLSK